ncbi:MAG: hypoxanthine phosphoribosyltransferase [Clostridia bacterium]|nr:hypoxanthine phosphoribosyltransferase [Clostridia bacterium]
MILHEDLDRILITAEDIKKRVAELGRAITEEYRDAPEPVVLVCILKGSVVFFSDLMRQIDHDCRLDFMIVKSYGGGTESSGNVRFVKDLDNSITGKHVVIVEDIIDSGLTLTFLKGNLITRGAKTLKICTLLDKPVRRSPKSTITVDYCGFTIPNEFVVGYGLDYDEKYRNLPDIGVLKPEVYTKA